MAEGDRSQPVHELLPPHQPPTATAARSPRGDFPPGGAKGSRDSLGGSGAGRPRRLLRKAVARKPAAVVAALRIGIAQPPDCRGFALDARGGPRGFVSNSQRLKGLYWKDSRI